MSDQYNPGNNQKPKSSTIKKQNKTKIFEIIYHGNSGLCISTSKRGFIGQAGMRLSSEKFSSVRW